MSTPSAIWVDGERLGELGLPDRGLDFGDGLFETLLLEDNKPLFPDLHWRRLQKGLGILQFPDCLPLVSEYCRQAIESARSENHRRAALRVTVTRGAGPRGYAPPPDAVPRVIVSIQPLSSAGDTMPEPASLICSSIRWGLQPALSGIKHLNRLEQVLAAGERLRAGADEALMLDQRDHLVSVASGNLYLVIDGEIHTPPIEECGIAGTRRQLLIEEWAPAAGYRVLESALPLSAMETASEVFCSNALWGLRPVSGFAGRRWTRYPVCSELFARYRRAVT